MASSFLYSFYKFLILSLFSILSFKLSSFSKRAIFPLLFHWAKCFWYVPWISTWTYTHCFLPFLSRVCRVCQRGVFFVSDSGKIVCSSCSRNSLALNKFGAKRGGILQTSPRGFLSITNLRRPVFMHSNELLSANSSAVRPICNEKAPFYRKNCQTKQRKPPVI